MSTPAKANPLVDALFGTLSSPNETDSNLEAANVVDGLFAIARALHHVAEAIENQPTGWDGACKIAEAIEGVGECIGLNADAIEHVSTEVGRIANK